MPMNKPKTIYIDLTSLCDRHWTGVEQFTFFFSKTLSSHFEKLNIINLYLYSSKHQEPPKGIEYFFLGKNRGRLITDYLLLPLFMLIHKPEYIVFPAIHPSLLCWIFKSKKTKIITVIHDTVPWHYAQTMSWIGRLLIQRCKTALKKSYMILTVSETEKAALQQLNPQATIFCVYSCIADEVLGKETNILETLSLNKKNYILSVSTLEPRKNFEYTLNTLYKLVERHPHLKIVLTGRSGWSYTPIMNVIKKLNDHIIFPGYVSNTDLSTLYKNALCYITLPIHEGFGKTPIEALLNGTPVIVSDIPVFHELLKSGVLFLPLNDEQKALQILEDNIDKMTDLYIDHTDYQKFLEENYYTLLPVNLFQ
jgi:glycosyltransferase involved in cell wall biosynthesis